MQNKMPDHILPTANFEGQDRDEKIILLLRQHPITQIPAIFTVLVLTCIPFIYLFVDSLYLHFLSYLPFKTSVFILIIWYLFLAGLAFERFLFWYFNVYILTNERIIDVDFLGVSAKKISETKLSQIQDISSHMTGALKVFFHYGDVTVQTAAESPEFEFHNVPNCDWVSKRIGEECRLEEAEPPGKVA